jgi:hypothetical protein
MTTFAKELSAWVAFSRLIEKSIRSLFGRWATKDVERARLTRPEDFR